MALRPGATMVAQLSNAGQAEFEKRIARVGKGGAAITVRVHEVFRHLVRQDGDVRDATLVVIPTARRGARRAQAVRQSEDGRLGGAAARR